MTTGAYCSAYVSRGRGGASGCSRRGTIEENGTLWCAQHAPSAVKAKRDAWDAKYHAKRDAESDARTTADARAAELTERLGVTVSAEGVYAITGAPGVRGYRLVLPDEYIPCEAVTS